MAGHSARRVWATLETLHDVVYFAPQIPEAGIGLGLHGFWMTYFAFRASPLGPVGPEPVVAMFAGFEPSMVAKALPDAWSRATPEDCLRVRSQVSAAVLRELGVNDERCAAAAERLAPIVAAAETTGRPLFAANAKIKPGGGGIEALWQHASSLREHRGDGQVAALVAAGLSGLDGHLLQVASGKYPAEMMKSVRGWSEDDWSAAARRLQERDLLTADQPASLTELGRACLTKVEAATDNSSWVGAFSPLGLDGVEKLVELLSPDVEAVWASGIIPAINPIGLDPMAQ